MKALGKTYAEIHGQTKTATLNLTGFQRGVSAATEVSINITKSMSLFGVEPSPDVAPTPAPYRLPAPKPLRVGQYTEHHGGRPFIEARVSRGWWIWKRFVDVAFYRV